MLSLPLRGVVIYRGPSRIDGRPIVAIATLKTDNAKTGNMVQTWILREDVDPTEAINSGADESICGSCPLRGIIQDGRNRQRACYVQVRNAPRGIWYAWQRGLYPDYNPRKHKQLFRGRKLRLGSYGDPVAVPYRVWKPLVAIADGHTGYTHQWQDAKHRSFRRWLMASVDSLSQATLAKEREWRYFRTMHTADDIGRGEILCPASDEAGKRRQCETCLACNGSNGNAQRVSIAIVAHGSKATLSSYRKMIG
jgi:hypothetical protein